MGASIQPCASLLSASQSLQRDKYWCPVNRIDNVYGDRNLLCSCPSTSELQEARNSFVADRGLMWRRA